MHVGVFSFNAEYAMRVDELARASEERGFESLWAAEHSHVPAGEQRSYAGDQQLPKAYYHIADPFISLMAAAGATRTLKVGTAICAVIQHHPISLAKRVATLDQLSNGRFLFGIGGGWNRAEVANHGVAFGERWKIVRERVEAMKAIWTQEEASYHGEFVDFDGIICNPKPLQKPFPPIIMGSANEPARRRVARYCDGWMAVDIRAEHLPKAITDLHHKLEDAGRDPRTVPISVFCAGETSPDTLLRYQDLGADRAIIMTPAEKRDTVLRFLDGFVRAVDQVS